MIIYQSEGCVQYLNKVKSIELRVKRKKQKQKQKQLLLIAEKDISNSSHYKR